MAESSFKDSLGRSRVEVGVEVTVAILVCLTALSGNLLLVYVIKRESILHNVTNIFIFNLALTDIAMATINMPLWIASLYTGTWNFSQTWCQLAGSIMTILAYTSLLTMGLIAINRYLHVVKPTLYKKIFPSKRVARLYCILVWLFTFLIATPYVLGWVGVLYYVKLWICTPDIVAYTKFSTGVFINGVMIIIFYCHFKIYKAVRGSTENLNAHAEGNGVGSLNDSHCFSTADVKVLKACFTVACFYVITWCPISITAFIQTGSFDIVYTISVYLMLSSSLVNPFIYGIMNPQFNLAFKRALSCGHNGRGNTNQNSLRNGVGREVSRRLETAT